MITRRDLVTAAIAASVTLACVSLADEPVKLLDSTAWQWADLSCEEDRGRRAARGGPPADAHAR